MGAALGAGAGEALEGRELGSARGVASTLSLRASGEHPALLSSSHLAIFRASRVYARHSPA